MIRVGQENLTSDKSQPIKSSFSLCRITVSWWTPPCVARSNPPYLDNRQAQRHLLKKRKHSAGSRQQAAGGYFGGGSTGHLNGDGHLISHTTWESECMQAHTHTHTQINTTPHAQSHYIFPSVCNSFFLPGFLSPLLLTCPCTYDICNLRGV